MIGQSGNQSHSFLDIPVKPEYDKKGSLVTESNLSAFLQRVKGISGMRIAPKLKEYLICRDNSIEKDRLCAQKAIALLKGYCDGYLYEQYCKARKLGSSVKTEEHREMGQILWALDDIGDIQCLFERIDKKVEGVIKASAAKKDDSSVMLVLRRLALNENETISKEEEHLISSINIESLNNPQDVFIYAVACTRRGSFKYHDMINRITTAFNRIDELCGNTSNTDIVTMRFHLLDLIYREHINIEQDRHSNQPLNIKATLGFLGAA